jgi:tripartite ATP-independent transporter DctM subunit
MGALYLIILVGLFMIGLPVAISLGSTAMILSLLERGSEFSPNILIQRATYGVNNFLLLSIPFFLYAGKIMNIGSITTRIFSFASALVGSLKGGLGHVNIVASLIFSGMTGTATSDVAGLGAIELKAMKEAGYEDDFAIAITGVSSTIGPIVPPSVPLVIYGLMTGVSIGSILIAGLIPGFLMAVAMMIYVELYAVTHKMERGGKFDFRIAWSSFKSAFLSLLTPLIIIGGILSGVFTPTEAAAVAALYATFLTVFIYREVSFRQFMRVLKETVQDTGTIMFIAAMAMTYGYLITRSNIAVEMADAISTISTNPYVIGLILLVFLLFVGCFLESIAAITILAPVFLPVLAKSSIDPLHFGIVMVLTLMIGLLTPPFGMVLFILNRLTGVPLSRIVKKILPFLIPLLIVDLVIVFFPGIVTFLPNLIFRKG